MGGDDMPGRAVAEQRHVVQASILRLAVERKRDAVHVRRDDDVLTDADRHPSIDAAGRRQPQSTFEAGSDHRH